MDEEVGYETLRLYNDHKGYVQSVAHLFPSDNYWWPLREAACGREYPAENLRPPRAVQRICQQCLKEAM